jgi:hypothetical protein
VFELTFAPEHQRELERLLAALPPEVFKASDSLGWVYQFWQAKRKDEVNASEVKIGADELPAVTQLFTEPYMVDFLLHNSLGAWWVTRYPGMACPVTLTYLRTLEDGTPAAGKFEGWPDRLDDFKLLDPCCGSGHFLVAAFLLLVPMRMAAEGLSAIEAVDAVLAENLHGLEIDARCVEIAVFALALTAWRYPDENGDPLGVRKEMPAPQIACCGLKVAAKPEDWMALVPDDAPNAQLMRQELRLLHASFAQAPLLGSLLDPARSLKDDLATSSLETLRKLLERALASERPTTTRGQVSQAQNDGWDMALTAKGVLEAAALLGQTYELVVTNVPYLTGKRMSEGLGDHAKRVFPDSKSDLATVFLERAIEFCSRGGVSQLVMTQNWLFLAGYKKLREKLLQSVNINLLAKLGGGAEAFESGPGNITNICLLTVTKVDKNPTRSLIRGIDVSERKTPPEKAALLITKAIACRLQEAVLANPDSVITTDILASSGLLSDFVEYSNGIQSGDSCRFTVNFWELSDRRGLWDYIQTPSRNEGYYCGIDSLFRWDSGRGDYWNYVTERLGDGGQRAWIRGLDFRGRGGVAISATGNISCCLYFGEFWNDSVLVLTPNDPENLSAVYAFCKSSNFEADVRLIDQKLNVRSAVTKVRFDVQRWREAAAALLPEGIPKAFTNDVAEAAFHGHPQPTTDPIQVAVARLAGYRWPAETDTAMELADEARTWIARSDRLAAQTDDDGIVCLPSVRGEAPAHDRLLKLLIAAWETVQPGSWKPAVLDKLLADAECAGKGLDVWLREKFFEQHAKRFKHRPFIWHVWDGLKDGFAALVNYHRLDAKNLERLIHTYLGDWIRQQEAGVRDRIDGAPTRLAAAQDLKRRLELILEGEQPYDIFVRWKPMAEQPIGWNPDLNDGVRLNIRPFMTAEVLRHNKKPKLNITWDKDRGKDVESAPWFKTFGGDRINDHHLTLAEKIAAKGSRP